MALGTVPKPRIEIVRRYREYVLDGGGTYRIIFRRELRTQ